MKEKQLGIYILIEIKHKLLILKHFEDTIAIVNSKGISLDFDSFTNFRPNVFENECLTKKMEYSRVVSKDTFNNYIGDFMFNKPFIDNNKIKINGWSTSNKVVWITPKNEINKLINSCTNPNEIANYVCDYLGLPRKLSDEEYVKIDYSPLFKDCVFQPNSSNIKWDDDYILFVPIKKTDYYGKTYNENGVTCAREQIHTTSFYIDDNFDAQFLGKITEKHPINDKILIEAENRFKS